MKIYLFKKLNNKALGGVEVEDDEKEINGYVYGYGKDLESARRDAERFLEYVDIDFTEFDKIIEADKDWLDEIWK